MLDEAQSVVDAAGAELPAEEEVHHAAGAELQEEEPRVVEGEDLHPAVVPGADLAVDSAGGGSDLFHSLLAFWEL